VPVLARCFEAAGLSTVMVTNMPFWAEKIGVPRTLAVEFPFGHMLGQPHDVAQQARVIREALQVLATAEEPGTIVHSRERWPGSHEEAVRVSHSETEPPISGQMGRYIGRFLRGLRRGRGERAQGPTLHPPTGRGSGPQSDQLTSRPSDQLTN
jgi:D-proline reductase (dithiol) PrdB